ncbi:MAG: hypothetical protein M1826_005312 [Phylliscum demangeonii]|nr:MAG: hypothetical protein M1826_005312 [Phylliscum demangeonii]
MVRLCKKCHEPLLGQFVRALGGTYHLECFKCRDCGQIVASKFFPVDKEEGDSTEQYPLCETDYFRRLDLLCHECGGALRGSYITAVERKYHIEHFTCSVCPTVFGAQDNYYEHGGKVYCHYHYSTQFAERCNGCHSAILKQFVEIFRGGQNQHWHPECYMIHKFWNVRLAPHDREPDERRSEEGEASTEERALVRQKEELMEAKVFRIWRVLSTFEESSAACISDMLLHVSNGAYVDGVQAAKKFILHIDYLFQALDKLDARARRNGNLKGTHFAAALDQRTGSDAERRPLGLSYGREAKLLCRKVVAFFMLLSKTQETGVRKLGVTQELLSLVTGLAHYLKLLIRISLQGALKLERESRDSEGLYQFLEDLAHLEFIKEYEMTLDLGVETLRLAGYDSDLCIACRVGIEDECVEWGGERKWHLRCVKCRGCGTEIANASDDARWAESQQQLLCRPCAQPVPGATKGFKTVTKLEQYIYLLKVALARLLARLRQGGLLPHTSDDPNLTTYDANKGHRVSPSGTLEVGPPRLNTRSKSYGGPEDPAESSYSQTLGDIRRLRSSRMDRRLSSTPRKARTSRIIDGPEADSARPGSNGGDQHSGRHNSFQIVEDTDANGDLRHDLTLHQDALTLDDIPRIVAAEQAKEHRPNAYKHARDPLLSDPGRLPKLLNGHQRGLSVGNELERAGAGEPAQRVKKYFSELSALEYFIVRHVAVLSLSPLVDGHFNLEELLGLIETRKPTFWGKFGKAFKNDGRKVGKKKGVFGVALEALVERDGAESSSGVGPGALRVPALLDDAVSAMRQMDMSVEGVFRKNGNIRRLKELADAIDKETGDYVDLTKESPVQVAALLKKFLRELPYPLLTVKLHRLFICSQKIPDEETRRRVLHLTCCLLPKSHRDSMEILFTFLNWASSFSHVDEDSGSKMDIHNLATVVTPNILYSNNKNAGMDESFLAIEAVHSLIEYNEAMCEVPEDLQSILNDNTLFNGSADITTKEILKRYGNVVRSGGPPRTVANQDASSSHSKEGRGNVPIATRVDTDPSQATAWQKESSVRHVEAGAGPANTPPQGPMDPSDPHSPWRPRTDSHGGSPDAGNRDSQYSTSGWVQVQKPADELRI